MMQVAIGMKVRYHPIIGGKHDGNLYEVRAFDTLPSGQQVAWLKGKAGCVSVRALSQNIPGADNYGLGHDD